MVPYWTACTRMVRADYCGDGTTHTRDGTLITFGDTAVIRPINELLLKNLMEFEAVWGPNGAICVRRVRIGEVYSLDALRGACPRFQPEDLGAGCTEARMSRDPDALLLNKSFEK
jgi:hypothetical protein